jgi:uncharacterized protein with von Willebrand factor type A (vWA) domain
VNPSILQVFEIRSDQALTSAKQTIINKLKDAAREGRIVFISVSDPEKHYLSLLNEAKRDNASRESVNATIQLYQSLAASLATGDIIVFHGKSSEAADRDRQQTQSQTSKPLVNAGDVAVILTLISRAGWQERNLERQRKNKVLQQLGQIYLVQLPGSPEAPEALEQIVSSIEQIKPIYERAQRITDRRQLLSLIRSTTAQAPQAQPQAQPQERIGIIDITG